MDLQVILKPTEDWLKKTVAECRTSFIAASPFVGPIFEKIIDAVPVEAQKVLVTRMDLRVFAMGISDRNTIFRLAEKGVTVMSLPRLHAKVYVIDSNRALVTSGNATEGGLRWNVECGIAISDDKEAKYLSDLVLSGFGTEEKLACWKPDEIANLEVPVRIIKKSIPAASKEQIDKFDLPKVEIPDIQDIDQLISSLKGWTSLTFKVVMAQSQDQFSLVELFNAILPLASKRYPANRHVRAKLRQQLQKLRDLGFIEFLGDGIYRRLLSLKTENKKR